MLADGSYDVLVVDADVDSPSGGQIRMDLTVLSGPHKGEVITLVGPNGGQDPLELLAMPGTVVVRDGEPFLTLEP